MEEPHELEETRNPLWYIVALFLILSIVTMSVPYWAIKNNPEPRNIPTLEDIYALGIIQKGQIDTSKQSAVTREDFRKFVIVNPEIKTVADNIVATSCGSGERICHAKALFYFVRDELDYVSDPSTFEYVKNAQESLISKGGDCDDASVLLASLLKSVGVDVRFVFVPGHVYVEAWMPEAINRYKQEDGWIVLDSTCRNCDFGELVYKYQNSRKENLKV